MYFYESTYLFLVMAQEGAVLQALQELVQNDSRLLEEQEVSKPRVMIRVDYLLVSKYHVFKVMNIRTNY